MLCYETSPASWRSEMIIAVTEKSNHADDDQVKSHDVVQEPGHDKNEYPGEQRYQRSKTQLNRHDSFPFSVLLGQAENQHAYAAADQQPAEHRRERYRMRLF